MTATPQTPIEITVVDDFRIKARFRWYEILFWLVAFSGYFVFPNYLPLGAQILITGLFALSLDLILGYGGIVSLGHTTFFGLGAYTAGLLAVNGWTEPISALLIGGAVAALAGWLCSFVIVRVQGLALLLVTLGINLILYEIANKAYSVTGGEDGLQGIKFQPILGLFRFDIYGRTAYIYALVIVFICFLVSRRIVNSPFGLALTGMRENWKRMPVLGASLRRHGSLIFTLSAFFAGIAGAVLTETTNFVAVDSAFGVTRSAEVLTMLIMGGTGVLYGGFVGSAVFMVMRDQLASLQPAYWYFWIGLILVVVVLFTRNGIVGWVSDAAAYLSRWRSKQS